jgi:hypothetical protein
MAKIVISSGHSTKCRGMSSQWLDEVEQATAVVDRVGEILNGAGVETITYHDTISDDQSENLNRIVNFHNSKTRDLDTSVHFNASETTSKPMGCEVWYITQDDLATEVSAAIAAAGRFKDRGKKYTSNLFFLNNTNKPAVLLEVCFGDSSADCNLYYEHFDEICLAIAESLSGREIIDVPPEAGTEPPPEPPAMQEAVLSVGSRGPEVAWVQAVLGVPADGYFGGQTEAAVRGFQAACGIGVDGIVGPDTWGELNTLHSAMTTQPELLPPALAADIVDIANGSAIADYSWDDRGRPPPGYIAGMALTFAYALRGLGGAADALEEMSQAATSNDDDVLSYYRNEFAQLDMDNSEDGPDTLRHLFAFLIGLGMRETSGNHWCGRDASASNVSATTAEAGLMQTSWNIETASEEIDALFDQFWPAPQGFRPLFSEGLDPSQSDLANYGSGRGASYQWLAKYCPAFAVYVTAVGLRYRCDHWGPVIRREVELLPEADEMLREVQRVALPDGVA